ncbi:SH3 domain-containing protein [Streptomyces canus]|uniref:SH3 domain-containing protein n=1 Tax=Streptomyces canus TaxID=58343 RepID=UPI0030DE4892
MSLRSRLSIAVAAGALAVTALATPAVAGDDPDDPRDDWGQNQTQDQPQGQGQGQGQGQTQNQGQGQGQGQNQGQTQNQGQGQGQGQSQGQNQGQGQSQGQTQNQGQGQNQEHNPRLSRGIVTAGSLALRSAPNRGGQIIRWADRGEVVSIFCKTNGQSVQGNRQWYLLTDGTWAWGSARYIRTIGTAPRWC